MHKNFFDTPFPEKSSYCAFSGNKLERFSERRSETCVAEALADPKAQLIIIAEGKLVLREQGEAFEAAFKADDLAALKVNNDGIVLLGWDENNVPWLAAPSTYEAEQLPVGFTAMDYRSIYIQGLVDEAMLGNIAQGGALLAWHKSHAFCSRCGKKSAMADGGYKRVCTHCEAQHFPRTDPVVIMFTVNEDNTKCLMGRSPHFLEGMYSCLAGFVEPGETLEMAVRRETMEEAGIKVGRIAYHASQPWPFPYTMMIGCYGVATSSKITIDDELEDCRWFTKEEVQQMQDGTHPEELRLPPKGAIANNLIADWLAS